MSARLAPASILRASALASGTRTAHSGVAGLARGFHLRVSPSPWIGFPIHPFAAWRLPGVELSRHVDIAWTDARGHEVAAPFDLDQAGGTAIGFVRDASGADPMICLEIDMIDEDVRVDVLDGATIAGRPARVVATRRRPPFRFGHSEITIIRVTGSGLVGHAQGIRLSDLGLDDFSTDEPAILFGLPLPAGPWYTPGPLDPNEAARRRVLTGAPERLNPPDDPTAREPGKTFPSAEAERIMLGIAPLLVDPWLSAGYLDGHVAPGAAMLSESTRTEHGEQLTATAAVTPSLLTMAVDPQIARYLGLATTIDFEDGHGMEAANVWLIAGRWAVQRNRGMLWLDGQLGSSVRLDDFIGEASVVPDQIVSLLDLAVPGAGLLVRDIESRLEPDIHGPWGVVTLLTVAVAAGDAPPDPPDPFALSAAEPGAWNAYDPSNPSPETWRQTISLGTQPARGMVGFARQHPGPAIALHRIEPSERLGHLGRRAVPLVPNWASNNERVLTDREVPSDPSGAIWTVWQADEFGQWSDGATFERPLPRRPFVADPVIEARFEPAAPDDSTGPRVPGRIVLRMEVPESIHLPPGNLPIIALDLTMNSAGLPRVPVRPGTTVVHQLEVRPFDVGEHDDVLVRASYVDASDRPSPSTVLTVAAFDTRSPSVIPTSPVIIWSSPADATGQAEIALRWPPRTGAARYRLYLGDGRRLADALEIGVPAGIRSELAGPVHARRNELVDKRLFTFLGEVSGVIAADGFVHWSARLPGSLRTVQFLRVVPATAGGAEASFEACGLVPIAVPATERPPPPLLDAETDPTTGLRLTVRARGLRQEVLAMTVGGVPEFRLRSTRRGPRDPLELPVRSSAALQLGTDGVWTAIVDLPLEQLEPFVRTTWYAEVRYPAEPPVPPGTSPVPVDGCVVPEWTTIATPAENVWSAASLPASSLLVPRDVPTPGTPVIDVAPGGVATLQLTDLPVTHPHAIGPNRLEIYRAEPGESPRRSADLPITAPALAWTDPVLASTLTTYHVVLVDPAGRRGPVAHP